MKKILLSICCVFLMLKVSFCQSLEKVIGKKTIENYQNYLIVNPETPFLITITDSLRQMWDRENIKIYHCFCYCNCLEIIVNSKDKIYLEGKLLGINQLQDSLEYSFRNPDWHQDLPEIETIITKDFGPVNRSKGIIDIITKNIDSASYSRIIEDAKQVFLTERQFFAKLIYAKNYEDLSKEIKSEIDTLFPFRIRFERYIPEKLRLPNPPRPKISETEGFQLDEDKINDIDE